MGVGVADSIKTRIVKRVLEICQPLVTDGKVRLVVRKSSLFLLEPIKPAIHLVVGDESDVVEDERGYTARFPLMVKIILDDARDPYGASDFIVPFVQGNMEADEQLDGLASKITYDGELPFTEEALKPDGGTVLMYLVEYRRMRGDATVSY
jgi:hypothetical protein